MHSSHRTGLALFVAVTGAMPAAACSGHSSPVGPGGASSGESFNSEDGSGSGSSGSSAATTDCSALARPCSSCTDFPASPVIDAQPDDGSPPTPSNAASRFTAPGLGADGPYVTAIVDDGSTLSTYPALYIWNQPTTYSGSQPFSGSHQSNHTPTWEIVDIPPVAQTPR